MITNHLSWTRYKNEWAVWSERKGSSVGRLTLTLMHTWWRHRMEAFSALLAICAGNSPVTGEFPTQRPVTRSFDVFFDLHPNKRLSKQWWGWWLETPSWPLRRHRNDIRCLCFFSFVSYQHDNLRIPLTGQGEIWMLYSSYIFVSWTIFILCSGVMLHK